MNDDEPTSVTPDWSELVALGEQAGALLRDRRETVAVAEGSSGGLVSAALLAVPGASAWYVGGAVVYAPAAVRAFTAPALPVPTGMRGATEEFAGYLATAVSLGTRATWGIGEAGAAGPPNRYGDPAGHSWSAVARGGDAAPRTRHLLTGSDDRVHNMSQFAAGALRLLIEVLDQRH